MKYGMKVGMMSGHHGLYELGYIRATMGITKRYENVSFSETN